MSLAVEDLIGITHVVDGVAILPHNDAIRFLSQSKIETVDKTQRIKASTSSLSNDCQIFPVEQSNIKYFYGAQHNLPDMQSVLASQRV